jgi:acyl carrier protein
MKSIITNTDYFLAFTAQELLVPKQKVTLDVKFRELENWNSLNALIYISRINEETGVIISSTDLSNLKTIEDVYSLVVQKVAIGNQ